MRVEVAVLGLLVPNSVWSYGIRGRTLRASLSGTFLQTLPDLVTPLKGHSLSPRSCVHRRDQYPPKGSGTDKTVEAT